MVWRIFLPFQLGFLLVMMNGGSGYHIHKVCKDSSGTISIGTRGNRLKSVCVGCEKLRNCTTVLGSVHLKGISLKNDKELAKQIQFPLLKEITGHLIVTFLEDVRSLSDILPNLAVIRGRIANLFKDYAFVVYRNAGLRTLGLNALTTVKQGGIKIEFNPFLCYLDRVRWKSLMNHEKYELSIGSNSQDCFDKCLGCQTPSGHGSSGISYCWAEEKKNCQTFCHSRCRSSGCKYGSEEICCHPECLGGCTKAGSPHYCNACQNVRLQSGECVKECPAGLKELDEFSCSDYCPKHFYDYLGKCVKECPAGYTKNITTWKCDKCPDDNCPRVCTPDRGKLAIKVHLLSDSAKLKGCTKIEGDLEIEIRKVPGGTNIAQVLSEDLGNIEEVKGYVVVRQSSSLISLNFFKKLKRITASFLFSTRYALAIFDNPNLESLWDFDPNFNIAAGGVFVQLNPRLCLHNVYPLIDDVLKWNRNETNVIISETTNGNAGTCNVHRVNITVTPTKNRRCKDLCVKVSWPNKIGDHRNVLLYSIWYRETINQDIDEYDDIDACNSDHVWNRKDVYSKSTSVEAGKQISENVGGLSGFKLYAFRVEAFVIESKGVKSAIAYFMTKETIPSQPRAVQVGSRSSDSLEISWKIPFFPNGNITHYTLRYKEIDSSYRWKKGIDQEVWCKNQDLYGIRIGSKYEKTDTGETDEKTCPMNITCNCGNGGRRELGPELKEALFAKDFQDTILSAVFRKKDDNDNNDDVKKKTTPSTVPTTVSPANTTTTSAPDCANNDKNSSCTSSRGPTVNLPTSTKKVASTMLPTTQPFPELKVNTTNETYVIQGLKYFTEYSVEVCACNGAGCGTNENFVTHCSKAVGRTDKNATADDVGNSLSVVASNHTRQFTLTWSAPKKPNGAVLRYDVWIQPGNKTGKTVCISAPNTRYGDIVTFERYSAQVRAITPVGNGSWSNVVTFIIAEKGSITGSRSGTKDEKLAVIVGISLATIVILSTVFAFVLYVFLRKRYKQAKTTGVIYASVNPEYLNCSDVYIADEWEVPREKITLIKELGNGSFGMVYQGEAKDLLPGDQCCKVAVKTVSENGSIRDRVEFLKEASIMKAFNCNHVVRLLGVVSAGQPVLVVMELMENGDLKSFLRSRRPEEQEEPKLPPPTDHELYHMAAEIADGMAYLTDNKFVHRDLAARNCMVSSNCNCKIGDFGMARDIYETDYYRKGGKGLLPVRWMPPESLKDGVFTGASDVWSFGVVLWEMATLAEQPYQGKSNEEVMKYVLEGQTMDIPEDCPEVMLNVIMQCWQHKPKVRPSFASIVTSFEAYVSESFVERSFYHNERRRRDTEDSIQSTITENEILPEEANNSTIPAADSTETTQDDNERESVV